MISGKTTIKTVDLEFNIEVVFSVSSLRFEIIIPFMSEKSLLASDYLYPSRIEEIVIVDNTGQEYTAFDCISIKRIIRTDNITIIGQYKTLIKGRNVPQMGMLSFHFEGMEQFFAKSKNISGISSVREENKWNVVESDGMVKAIAWIDEVDGVDLIISLLVKVREYFEYLVGEEVMVDNAVINGKDESSVKIVNDNRLMTVNDRIFNVESHQNVDVIVNGLNKWLAKYDIYERVIYIWKKTIYNRRVSEEDVFIWRCQAFELLCTLYKPLFDAGKQCIKEPKKQPHPNLSNFLEGLNMKKKFIICNNSDFEDVKDVRNKYTHNNPDKHITERQWCNASRLINMALKVSINYVFELSGGNEGFFIFFSRGTKEEIRC